MINTESQNVVITLPKIELCNIFDAALENPFIAGMLNLIKSFEGNLMDICDKIGDIKASNISFRNSTFISMFPAGNYKTSFKVYDEIDSNIFNLTYYSTAFN